MPKASLSKTLKDAGVKSKPKRVGPVWKGPCSNDPQGGVTQSLLSRFLCCRERFRIYAIEGLRTADTFNVRLEYGNMWHICEEHFANSGNPVVKNPVATAPWLQALNKYAEELCNRYRMQKDQVVHWYNVCKVQFPLYVAYWSKHEDVKQRTPLLQEETFCVPYRLKGSGLTVYLRGKWDSVDLIGKGKTAGVYLQENKTKGDIKERQLQQQLTFDLQTMFYLTALDECNKFKNIRGVRYNVVRRPLAGGKHSIVQHKPTKSNPGGESSEEFYGRLGALIKENADHFFMRWKVDIAGSEVIDFQRNFLEPILEQLCEWYDYMSLGNFDVARLRGVHWRMPYGVWNPALEGAVGDLDEYLASGSEVGLERVDNLFRELNV